MASVNVGIDFNLLDVRAHFEEQRLRVLDSILDNDVPAALANGQANGFPTDEDEYTLLLRNRGATRKRKLKTINARKLKIGTKGAPLEFKFVSGATSHETVIEAAIRAEEMLRARVPIGGPYSEPSKQNKPRYWKNITLYVGDDLGTLISVTPQTLRNWNFKENDRVFLGSPVPHAAIIEHGFYFGYYQTQRLDQGILVHIKRKIERQFRGKISIRFRYSRVRGEKGVGTMPVIEFGLLGQFATGDQNPGTGRRRKSRNFK